MVVPGLMQTNEAGEAYGFTGIFFNGRSAGSAAAMHCCSAAGVLPAQ